MIKNNAESSMLVFTLDNKLKDPVFLLSTFLQTGFNKSSFSFTKNRNQKESFCSDTHMKLTKWGLSDYVVNKIVTLVRYRKR